MTGHPAHSGKPDPTLTTDTNECEKYSISSATIGREPSVLSADRRPNEIDSLGKARAVTTGVDHGKHLNVFLVTDIARKLQAKVSCSIDKPNQASGSYNPRYSRLNVNTSGRTPSAAFSLTSRSQELRVRPNCHSCRSVRFSGYCHGVTSGVFVSG